ncbi:MAG: hypothetical protein WBL20_17760 [Sphingobium sp.]|uniref:hypothetical protein n=1 Tax=Sphingobium sp. TaxID=1912891 RepID=UPI003BB0B023
MHIELRNIEYSEALSIDSTAYAAEVWIDGELAFRARNSGTGGADFITRQGRRTEDEVSAWLKANRPRPVIGGVRIDHDLEWEIGLLLNPALEHRRLIELMQTHLVTIEHGQIYQYPFGRYARANVRLAVLRANPDAIILNDAGEAALHMALDILTADH